MNIIFITFIYIGFIVSEIPSVRRTLSVFWHCPYYDTFPYLNLLTIYLLFHTRNDSKDISHWHNIYIYIYISHLRFSCIFVKIN